MPIRATDARRDAGPGPEALARFEAAGWAVLPGFLTDDETARLRAACLAACEAPAAGAGRLRFFDRRPDGAMRLARIERISDGFAALDELGLGARMAEAARRCLGAEATLLKDKLNLRHPGSPGYAPHQDAARWQAFGTRFVSVGLFLRDSDPAHGGFEFAGHDPRGGLKAHRRGDLDPAAFAAGPLTPVAARAGDAILIDGTAPHRTADNASAETVLHLLFTYASGSTPGLRDAFYRRQVRDFASVRHGDDFIFPAR